PTPPVWNRRTDGPSLRTSALYSLVTTRRCPTWIQPTAQHWIVRNEIDFRWFRRSREKCFVRPRHHWILRMSYWLVRRAARFLCRLSFLSFLLPRSFRWIAGVANDSSSDCRRLGLCCAALSGIRSQQLASARSAICANLFRIVEPLPVAESSCCVGRRNTANLFAPTGVRSSYSNCLCRLDHHGQAIAQMVCRAGRDRFARTDA